MHHNHVDLIWEMRMLLFMSVVLLDSETNNLVIPIDTEKALDVPLW